MNRKSWWIYSTGGLHPVSFRGQTPSLSGDVRAPLGPLPPPRPPFFMASAELMSEMNIREFFD